MTDHELTQTYNISPSEIIATEYSWLQELMMEIRRNHTQWDEKALVQYTIFVLNDGMGDILRHCAILKLIDDRRRHPRTTPPS